LAAAVIVFTSDMSALADLNKFEAEIRGEFGIGSAAQFGSADLRFISFFHLINYFIINTIYLGLLIHYGYYNAAKQCM
jgi:hypothetical protein